MFFSKFIILLAVWSSVLAHALPVKESWKAIVQDPELTAGYFEGDIVLRSKGQRNGLRDEVHRWTDNVVPYKFFTKFGKITAQLN